MLEWWQRQFVCRDETHRDGSRCESCMLHTHANRDNTPSYKTAPRLYSSDRRTVQKTGGAEVHIVTGRTYYDHVHYRSTRGKYKGRAFGFPPFQRGWCTFKRDSKEKAIAQCDVGYFDYVDVGIAADEKDRQNQLCESKRSILCELGITQADARAFCIRENILSPNYESQKRDGCALCPNANSKKRQQWFIDYPEAVDIVVELQEFVKIERPGQYPLRQYKFFIEKGGKIN